MTILNLLLDASQQGTQNNGIMSIIMLVLIFVVFYFFMIRPQTKKQKEIQKQRAAMKAGDSIITSGGIYGKIKEVKENTLLIEVAENVRIKVDKNSVFVTADDAQQAAAAAK